MTVQALALPRRRSLAVFVIVAALALGAAVGVVTRASAARAELSGSTVGIELCPQLLCGAATFIGYFGGEVDGRRSAGWWMIAARHDALPESGERSAVTGGRWSLSIAGGRTAGTVIGGSILNNGDDTFAITIALDPSAADGPALEFSGLLDHRTFPPTTRGALVTRAGG
ncbi:MAG: hypothetical protein O3B31_10985 [Chloroflexi bacterium]|nr:hypothetical protein [Chloroflexota bacterium]MDA1003851.1 hypothetical protein [Chloroflexota bacterium]